MELDEKRKPLIRKVAYGACVAFCVIGGLCSVLCFGVRLARKSPAYIEKPSYVEYIDNNGVFGTGYGGINTPTPVTEPAMTADGMPLTNATPETAAGPWAGIDAGRNDTDEAGFYAPSADDPWLEIGRNDTDEAGPYVPSVSEAYASTSTDFGSYEEYQSQMQLIEEANND